MTTSANYKRLKGLEEAIKETALIDAWKDPSIPQRQWDAIQPELSKMRDFLHGEVPPFRAFLDCVRQVKYQKGMSLLDIGASSGYYGELLALTGYGGIDYTALDYSPAFEEFAKTIYPNIRYIVADAKKLPVPDASYDIVVSGCVLIHLPGDWQQALAEAVRVSKKYILFHRTPLVDGREHVYWRKTAYDVPCIETWFSDFQFYQELCRHGLKSVACETIFENEDNDDYGVYGHYSILCEK